MRILTVAKYSWLNDAQLARIELKREGIESEIFDSEIAAANPLLGNAVGGIKLTVDEKDAIRAGEILQAYEQRIAKKHNTWCPNCESENVSKWEMSPLLKFISICSLGLIAVVVAKSFTCKDCGYSWR